MADSRHPSDNREPSDRPEEPRRPGGRLLGVEAERSLRDRLLARDERALVELVSVATPWLLAIAQGMLSDRDDAEEVVQDAFTIAWNRLDLLDANATGLIPWLLRIARNRAIDRLRYRRRQLRKSRRVETFRALGEGWVKAEEPREAASPGWHVHESVHRALTELPDEQLAAVRLAYFEGLTQSEIAERLAIPLGTVKTRLRLAFDKLRTRLAPIKDWVL